MDLALSSLLALSLLSLGTGSVFSPHETSLFREQAPCLQRRPKQSASFKSKCDSLTHPGLCAHAQCDPLECPEGQQLLHASAGSDCCPACVRLIEEGHSCDPRSSLARCGNGLECNPVWRQCQLPAQPSACQRDYHNRLWIRNFHKKFFIPPEPPLSGKTFALSYFRDLELPRCHTNTGQYEVTQRDKNKAFCVRPSDGRNTFGVVDKRKSSELTCQCASAKYDKLVRGVDSGVSAEWLEERDSIERIDRINVEHYADTHVQCAPSGNYQSLQCANETCLCVSGQHGLPITDSDSILEHDLLVHNSKQHSRDPSIETLLGPRGVSTPAAVIYGALNTLACFDGDKEKGIEDIADETYLQGCQKVMHRSSSLTQHFRKKGVTVRALSTAVCGYDDRFERKQCRTDGCRCTTPEGISFGTYGADLSDSALMDCNCALLEYFANQEQLPFDLLQCNGKGNFKSIQCYQGGQLCYCVDENGAKLSEDFAMSSYSQFQLKNAPTVKQESACDAMRQSVNSVRNRAVLSEQDHLYFAHKTKSFEVLPREPDSEHIYP